jgi:hypothetical protein
MMIRSKTVYLGSYVHSVSLDQLEHVEHAIICVGETGVIEWIEHAGAEDLPAVSVRRGLVLDDIEVLELGPDEFLSPGFIDTHTVRMDVRRRTGAVDHCADGSTRRSTQTMGLGTEYPSLSGWTRSRSPRRGGIKM